MISIFDRRRDMEKREREERDKLLKEHNLKFRKERMAIYEDCGKIGHVKGQFWDNGVGYTWYNCQICGGRIEDTVKWKYDELE